MVVLPLILGAVALWSAMPAQAQTYTVLHNFTGGGDGGSPYAGLTIDAAGSFYGVTFYGGPSNDGVAFRFARSGTGWTLSPLYEFRGGSGGAYPSSSLVIGPDGALYGTTTGGGNSGCFDGCGTVYKLTPPASFCHSVSCPWTETVLYRFNSTNDGCQPQLGSLVFDRAGNLYGTTPYCGADGKGVVYELSRSGGSWTETILWNFTGGNDGGEPQGSLLIDGAGNLYGTASRNGANNEGLVYELSSSGSGWNLSPVYVFNGTTNGYQPWAGLAMDAQGNLYGSTSLGGANNGGTAFELSPSAGGWTYTVMKSFEASSGPTDSPTLDAAGNVYLGCSNCGIAGSAVQLSNVGGVWNSNLLHGFRGDTGAYPSGSLVLDASGNVYGTTNQGGANNYGVIYQIAP